MKRTITPAVTLIFLPALIASCGGAVTANPTVPEAAASPTAPRPTPTTVPTPTPLPGSVVLPIDTLGKEVPWLPMDSSAIPAVYYVFFNVSKPPFNDAQVRQAFAAAIDREALIAVVDKYGKANRRPATTITPPEVLGRDLYNQVGVPFDPERARQLLTQAGYTDPSAFPAPLFLVYIVRDPVPAAHMKIAEAMTKMWKENLGVTVNFQVLTWSAYLDRMSKNPSEIGRLGWVADYADPDNFLREIFGTGAGSNYGHFSNAQFDELVGRAQSSQDPAVRQNLYIQAERLLCETEAAVIPIFHYTYKK